MSGKTSYLKRWVLELLEKNVNDSVDNTIDSLRKKILYLDGRTCSIEDELVDSEVIEVIKTRGCLSGMLSVISELSTKLEEEGLSSTDIVGKVKELKTKGLNAYMDLNF